jgi:Spy/CpxP family protein refolding chaperone
MKKITMIITMAALLIGSFTLVAWAEPEAGFDRFSGERRAGYFDSLNLSIEQQQKIMAIRHEFQKDTLILRNDLHKKNNELRQLWAADQLNQSAIDAKTREVNILKVQMITKQRAMREKMKGILTAEQLKKMKDHFQNGPSRFRDRRNFGGCWGEILNK